MVVSKSKDTRFLKAIHNFVIVVFAGFIGCFKEQRYKIFESNSQRPLSSRGRSRCCFKEQRYKIFESNSQLDRLRATVQGGLFQRAKIQDF